MKAGVILQNKSHKLDVAKDLWKTSMKANTILTSGPAFADMLWKYEIWLHKLFLVTIRFPYLISNIYIYPFKWQTNLFRYTF